MPRLFAKLLFRLMMSFKTQKFGIKHKSQVYTKLYCCNTLHVPSIWRWELLQNDVTVTPNIPFNTICLLTCNKNNSHYYLLRHWHQDMQKMQWTQERHKT